MVDVNALMTLVAGHGFSYQYINDGMKYCAAKSHLAGPVTQCWMASVADWIAEHPAPPTDIGQESQVIDILKQDFDDEDFQVMMVSKWVLIAEVIMNDGRRLCATTRNEDGRMWEISGLLKYGLDLEAAKLNKAVMDGTL